MCCQDCLSLCNVLVHQNILQCKISYISQYCPVDVDYCNTVSYLHPACSLTFLLCNLKVMNLYFYEVTWLSTIFAVGVYIYSLIGSKRTNTLTQTVHMWQFVTKIHKKIFLWYKLVYKKRMWYILSYIARSKNIQKIFSSTNYYTKKHRIHIITRPNHALLCCWKVGIFHYPMDNNHGYF